MTNKAAILLAVVLALLVRPLQLPAASCILVNAPAAKGCKPKCCANQKCCATSEKDSKPVSSPLYQNSDAKLQPLIGVGSSLLLDGFVPAPAAQRTRGEAPRAAHSPPPLAVTCIRLI